MTGKGNFENVEIHTDKFITLDTTRHISNLDIVNKDSKLVIGNDLTFQDIKLPEIKNPKNIITNHIEIKNQLNVRKEDSELVDYMAAKLVPVDGEFGMVTISVLNPGEDTNKYFYADRFTAYQSSNIGEAAPKDAIFYHRGNKIYYWLHKIFM